MGQSQTYRWIDKTDSIMMKIGTLIILALGICSHHLEFFCVFLCPLALSAKALSVGTPPLRNSLSYNCRSAELLSTFERCLKTDLFHIAYRKREHSA